MMSGCPEYDAFAEFYDSVLPYRDRPDVDFFTSLAREAGGPVLEIGCGTGRVLIPCARSGAEIVGLDLSEGMLAVCHDKLAYEPENVRARVSLVQADMRDFDLGRRFALVTLPFRPFQHLLTVEDQQRALAVFKRHLAPGGRLVIDLFNPSMPMLGDERWLATPLVEPPVAMPDGRTLVRSLRIARRDFINQVQDVEFTYETAWPDGRVERHSGIASLRYLFRFEAEHLLVREGFEIEALYGDYDRSPYGAKYPGELIFVVKSRSKEPGAGREEKSIVGAG
jgi:SAM-dependent methyltransferase